MRDQPLYYSTNGLLLKNSIIERQNSGSERAGAQNYFQSAARLRIKNEIIQHPFQNRGRPHSKQTFHTKTVTLPIAQKSENKQTYVHLSLSYTNRASGKETDVFQLSSLTMGARAVILVTWLFSFFFFRRYYLCDS